MKKFPKYVKLKNKKTGELECAMKLCKMDDFQSQTDDDDPDGKWSYWRHAGAWGFEARYIDGKLLSWHWNLGHPWLHRIELVECTEKEWKEDNKTYV